VPAQVVIDLLLAADPGRESRQVHLQDASGAIATHTGSDCIPWCGQVVHEGFSVAGNMLAGPQVIAETARVYIDGADLPFARRLIRALQAGEAAGGDRRGKQSAALDLRVDDHRDPLAELERLEQVSRERFVHFAKFFATRDKPGGVFDRAIIEAAINEASAN
jgi:uncharacterized Ntn-hydrolase superfamily protein